MTPDQEDRIEARIAALEQSVTGFVVMVKDLGHTVETLAAKIEVATAKVEQNSEILQAWHAIRSGGRFVTWAARILTGLLTVWLLVKAGPAGLIALSGGGSK